MSRHPHQVDLPSEEAVAIERVEVDSSRSAQLAAPTDYAERLGVESVDVGSAHVAIVRGSKSMYLNRVTGLGLGGAVSRKEFDTVFDLLADRRVKRFSIPLPPHARPTRLRSWLADRGLVERTGSSKMWRGADPLPEAEPNPLRIERIDARLAERWWTILSTVWPNFSARREWIMGRVDQEGWYHYLAFSRQRAVACAAMYVSDGVAHLLEGATLASHRRKGAQSALIHRRLADGLSAGCTLFTSETAPPLPRRPLVSYRNLRRAGFQLAYIRPIWRMEGN